MMSTPTQPTQGGAALWSIGLLQRGRAWNQWLMAAAMLTVLSVTPSVLRQQRHGRLSRDIVKACWPLWPIVLLFFGLFFGVLFGLAFDAAATLGLSSLVAEIVIRIVILEMAPVLVALLVLINITLPQTSHLRRRARLQNLVADAWEQGLHIEALPRLLASFFVVVLATVSSTVLLLVVAYGQLYGLSLSGFEAFTRLVGTIFEPAMVFAWTVKLLLKAWCVSILPMATLLVPSMVYQHNADLQLSTLIRVVFILLSISLLSLSAAYA